MATKNFPVQIEKFHKEKPARSGFWRTNEAAGTPTETIKYPRSLKDQDKQLTCALPKLENKHVTVSSVPEKAMMWQPTVRNLELACPRFPYFNIPGKSDFQFIERERQVSPCGTKKMEEVLKFLPTLRQVEIARPTPVSFTEELDPEQRREPRLIRFPPIVKKLPKPCSKRICILGAPLHNRMEIKKKQTEQENKIYTVSDSALHAEATERIKQLAKPSIRVSQNVNPNLGVSKASLRAVPTDRISQLALPRLTTSKISLPGIKEKLSVSKLSLSKQGVKETKGEKKQTSKLALKKTKSFETEQAISITEQKLSYSKKQSIYHQADEQKGGVRLSYVVLPPISAEEVKVIDIPRAKPSFSKVQETTDENLIPPPVANWNKQPRTSSLVSFENLENLIKRNKSTTDERKRQSNQIDNFEIPDGEPEATGSEAI